VDPHAGESVACAPWAGIGQFWFDGSGAGDDQQGQSVQACGRAVAGCQVGAVLPVRRAVSGSRSVRWEVPTCHGRGGSSRVRGSGRAVGCGCSPGPRRSRWSADRHGARRSGAARVRSCRKSRGVAGIGCSP
jgi:hypothetical protein